MEVSRRQFLTMAGAWGVAASMPAAAMKMTGLVGPGMPNKGAIKVSDLHHETFAPLVGTAFQVHGGAQDGLRLELESAREMGDNPAMEQFSLVFLGPAEPILPQGTYGFEHPKLGTVALFLVPIGRTGHGVRYEVAFNRMRP